MRALASSAAAIFAVSCAVSTPNLPDRGVTDPGSTDPGSTDDETEVLPEWESGSDAIFRDDVVHELSLTLSETSWAALIRDGRSWVHAAPDQRRPHLAGWHEAQGQHHI